MCLALQIAHFHPMTKILVIALRKLRRTCMCHDNTRHPVPKDQRTLPRYRVKDFGAGHHVDKLRTSLYEVQCACTVRGLACLLATSGNRWDRKNTASTVSCLAAHPSACILLHPQHNFGSLDLDLDLGVCYSCCILTYTREYSNM